MEFKGQLRYKTMTSENVSSDVLVDNFLFRRKVMFRSQDIQVFCIFKHPKSMTS